VSDLQVFKDNESTDGEEQLRILDSSGCLTPEVICFIEELNDDQQAAVERHLRSCTVCAQQQAVAAKAAERIRSGRLRVGVPADARIVARQAALKSVVMRRKREVVARQRGERGQRRKAAPPKKNAAAKAWLVLFVAAMVSLGVLIWLLLAS